MRNLWVLIISSRFFDKRPCASASLIKKLEWQILRILGARRIKQTNAAHSALIRVMRSPNPDRA